MKRILYLSMLLVVFYSSACAENEPPQVLELSGVLSNYQLSQQGDVSKNSGFTSLYTNGPGAAQVRLQPGLTFAQPSWDRPRTLTARIRAPGKTDTTARFGMGVMGGIEKRVGVLFDGGQIYIESVPDGQKTKLIRSYEPNEEMTVKIDINPGQFAEVYLNNYLVGQLTALPTGIKYSDKLVSARIETQQSDSIAIGQFHFIQM